MAERIPKGFLFLSEEELKASVFDPLHTLLAFNSGICKLFLGCLVNLPKVDYNNYKSMGMNEFVNLFHL